MTGDWFYLKRRWIGGTKQIGPITDSDLLLRIDRGDIAPETLVMSSKTKHKWTRMEEVGPAIKHWRKSHPPVEKK